MLWKKNRPKTFTSSRPNTPIDYLKCISLNYLNYRASQWSKWLVFFLNCLHRWYSFQFKHLVDTEIKHSHSCIQFVRSVQWSIIEKMKILESIQEGFSKLGVTSWQSIQTNPFNGKNVMCLVWLFLMTISVCIFLTEEATSLKEYVNILGSSITLVVIFIEFALHLWKIKGIFEFIDNFEELIEKSKYKKKPYWSFESYKMIILGSENPEAKLLYERHNQQVGKWNKTLIFGVQKVSFNLVLWPMFFFSYFTYFTTNLGSEAFQMPFFFW